MTADSTTASLPQIADVDLRLLDQEFAYLVQSSFHTDNLRDRFIQYYLVLVSAAVTILLGLLQISDLQANLPFFALIAFGLFLVGFVLVMIFVRLRRVVWECLVGMSLIKTFYTKYAAQRDDLQHALLWDQATVPQYESWRSASSLLVLLMIGLNSCMLAAGLFFALAWQGVGDALSAQRLLLPIFAFFLSCWGQYRFYHFRLSKEKLQAATVGRLHYKLAQLDTNEAVRATAVA